METTRAEDDDFVFIPIEQATEPPDGIIEHIKDSWWVVHQDKGVAFYCPRNKRTGKRSKFMASQCNSDEAIARHLAMRGPLKNVEVKFLPSVFKRVYIEDYI